MGQDISVSEFSAEDFVNFRQRLNRNLGELKSLLQQPDFGVGKPSFGAELELYIIDEQAKVKPINAMLLEQSGDDQLTLELNRFNMEYNFIPLINEARPFSKMIQQMQGALGYLSRIAEQHSARILPIGILPTLSEQDLGLSAITDVPRYHVLARALREKRGRDFRIQIEGKDKLDLTWGDVSLEGANTSFQFHYRVNPGDFAHAYNAAQLTTPLALALSANSPIFFGKRLWHETRVALFKQSIDYREQDELAQKMPPRVLFGMGWVREDIYEMFAEGVYLFEPLMPICSQTSLDQEPRSDRGPELQELRLHQGSIWTWNRPIYDPSDQGHVRIELRTMPAGPSLINMAATSALSSGLIKGLQSQVAELVAGLPFRFAENNFYRAAKYGMGARLFWPDLKNGTLRELPVLDILKNLLPDAIEGLQALGIEDQEIQAQIDVIEGTIETRMNGAQWQLNMYEKLLSKTDQRSALAELVQLYEKQFKSGKPVHEWSEVI